MKVTPELQTQILLKYEELGSMPKAAKALGISSRTVFNILHQKYPDKVKSLLDSNRDYIVSRGQDVIDSIYELIEIRKEYLAVHPDKMTMNEFKDIPLRIASVNAIAEGNLPDKPGVQINIGETKKSLTRNLSVIERNSLLSGVNNA